MMFTKRLAFQNPHNAKHQPLERAVFFNRFMRIAGTSRIKPAIRPQPRGNRVEICLNQELQQSFHDSGKNASMHQKSQALKISSGRRREIIHHALHCVIPVKRYKPNRGVLV